MNPLTIHPDQTLADVKALMSTHRISGIPVVERHTNRLVGIVRQMRALDVDQDALSEVIFDIQSTASIVADLEARCFFSGLRRYRRGRNRPFDSMQGKPRVLRYATPFGQNM